MNESAADRWEMRARRIAGACGLLASVAYLLWFTWGMAIVWGVLGAGGLIESWILDAGWPGWAATATSIAAMVASLPAPLVIGLFVAVQIDSWIERRARRMRGNERIEAMRASGMSDQEIIAWFKRHGG